MDVGLSSHIAYDMFAQHDVRLRDAGRFNGHVISPAIHIYSTSCCYFVKRVSQKFWMRGVMTPCASSIIICIEGGKASVFFLENFLLNIVPCCTIDVWKRSRPSYMMGRLGFPDQSDLATSCHGYCPSDAQCDSHPEDTKAFPAERL